MSKLTFNRLKTIYIFELRLLCLSKEYVLLCFAWILYIVSVFMADPTATSEKILDYGSGYSLISLFALFITSISATRAQRIGFDSLEITFPTGVEKIIGRWFANLTSGLIFISAPILYSLYIGASSGLLDNILLFIAENIITLTCITGLIWLLATLTNIRSWMYPVFALFWLGSFILPNVLTDNMLQTPGIGLIGFVDHNLGYYSQTWGRLQQGTFPDLFNLFYFCIAFLVFSLVVWRYYLTRFNRHMLLSIILTIFAFLAALVTGAIYFREMENSNKQIVNDEISTLKYIDSLLTATDVTYIPLSYNIVLDMSENKTPHFITIIEAQNVGNMALTEMKFTLYHQFEILDSSLPYIREGNYLVLNLPEALDPQDSIKFTLTYKALLWRLSAVNGASPQAVDFIRPEGVNLTCKASWYPIPGYSIPGRTFTKVSGGVYREIPDCLLAAPAQFTLSVTNSKNLFFASNLAHREDNVFSSKSTWAYLIGSTNLATSKINTSVTLIASVDQLDSISSLVVDNYQPIFEYIKHFIPNVPEHLTVLAIDDGFEGFQSWVSAPANEESLIVIVSPFAITQIERNPFYAYRHTWYAMLGSFWQEPSSQSVLIDNVAFFLRAHYLADGDSEQIRRILVDDLTQETTSTLVGVADPAYFEISVKLSHIYAEQGKDATINLLQLMQQNYPLLRDLTRDQLNDWIDDAISSK